MTEYRYRATDDEGNTNEGSLHSHSLEAAKDALVSMNLRPVEIYEKQRSLPADDALPPLYSDLQKIHGTPKISTESPSARAYFPLLETLRLYAGWLLAWYCLVYAVGSYQFQRELPVHVPYAESLFLSPLVLSFTFAAYLFLLLSGFYMFLGRKKVTGAVLLVVGIGLFLLYRINVN